MKKIFLFFLFLLLLGSCGSDELSNTRAYAEGRIKSQSLALEGIDISIISADRVVAQTIPTATGSFVLSGPLFSDGFKIKFSHKVTSFSSSASNCELSADSFSIIVPASISYVVFDEIKMQE